MTKDYSVLSDEELCETAKKDKNAEEFLLVKHKDLVRFEARNLYLSWGEWDDLLQEGMIGLLQAIRGYSKENGASFVTWAALCVRGKMLNAVTASNRKKHGAMEDYIPLDSPAFQSEDGSGLYGVGRYDNPESQVIQRENAGTLRKKIFDALSKTEAAVFTEYLQGMDYREIATKLNKSPKSIDNTLQRIRRKVRELGICPPAERGAGKQK
ncbi:MAG: sigma-70 family RNA polymerase sigma factor [Lachnospiraceae bacterium]|nr:sigma-70 family RNA polymerase sigma factor [Lachnospiraceae bacterium]